MKKSKYQFFLSRYTIFTGLAAVVLFLCSACSANKTDPSLDKNWLADGSISIYQTIPANTNFIPASLMGFLPTESMHQGNWLLIDTKKRTVSLMEGSREITNSSGQGINALQAGSYQVLHKQRNPLWYAPDSYFKSHQLPSPPEGDVNRYRRGALGDFALFITKDTPIHSGPVWTSEIGGVQINDNDLAKIYYLLPIGAPIEVR